MFVFFVHRGRILGGLNNYHFSYWNLLISVKLFCPRFFDKKNFFDFHKIFRGVQAWYETSISGLIRDLGCHLCHRIPLWKFLEVFRHLQKLFYSRKIKDFFKWTKKYFLISQYKPVIQRIPGMSCMSGLYCAIRKYFLVHFVKKSLIFVL